MVVIFEFVVEFVGFIYLIDLDFCCFVSVIGGGCGYCLSVIVLLLFLLVLLEFMVVLCDVVVVVFLCGVDLIFVVMFDGVVIGCFYCGYFVCGINCMVVWF